MLVDYLNQFVLFNNRGEQTLDRMGKGDSHLLEEDVEEGEISDSASIDEISEEDYNKQVGNVSKTTRVWTMQDLYKYPVSHNYTSDLYNLAWAQAVQNKPLDEVLVMELKPPHENSNLDRSSTSSSSMSGREDDNNNNNNNNGSSLSNSGKVINKVIIDVTDDKNEDAEMESEKEEGELEEGEIDLDSDVVETEEEGKLKNIDLDLNVNETYMDLKEEELEKRVNSIREELENVTPNDADKSFPEVCSRIENSLDGLGEVLMDHSFPTKDALIQLSLAAIRTVYSVFCSMNPNNQEHNRHILSSLLTHVTSQKHSLFSPEQMKELEVLIPSTADGDKNKEMQRSEGINKKDSDDFNENSGRNLNFSEKYILESVSNKSLDHNDYNFSSGTLKFGLSSAKGRGVLLPLLELHKDHDVDSLPSPTREAPPSLPINKVLVSGGVLKPEWPAPRAVETESTIVHPYEKDALKAVSTYQQKFGRSSFVLKDRLPSPTPSEECDDGDGDTSGEVSSSPTFGNTDTTNAPNLPPASISPVSHGLLSLGSNPALRSSARPRDPRLLLANAKVGTLDFNHSPLPGHNALKVEPLEGTVTSRKQKTVDEPVLDGPVQKRQRTGPVESVVVGDVQSVPLSGGWLEDSSTIGPPFINGINPVEKSGNVPWKLENEITGSSTSNSTPNVPITSNEQFPITGASPTASLQSLLKDIAVNPAIWMNIMKMEQEKSVITAKSTTPSSTNSILGAVPSMNLAPTKSSVMGQRSAGILQTPQTPVTSLQDELGKIRMKPRDPRRVLHNNTVQKGGNSGSDQFKTTGAPTSSSQGIKGNFDVQNQEGQSNNLPLPSQSIAPPDITRQFTSNLKNIADIMSATQAAVAPSVQIPSSQPVQVNLNKVDVKGVDSESDGQPNGTGSSSEEVTVGPSRSQNSWGDMEHLFEGFDDQQKAAIQRERARRIEEQRKMFAARKLCLVLDLDHTLLNSAKFMEVDPMHDEILRKKEEQDREKPQRHLFRFPQMGMWTKLRPGIWNFLEKASKLFEMHLYTMGNKLYATEMAKLLDAKGVLFDGRVISRGDDGDLSDGDEVPKSKDLDGVLGMESAVVIIDDSVRVWPHHKLNLIAVERYIYFPCSRRQFGLPGPSLLEIDHDERHEDGTLASSLAVIERIHENFFSHQSLDEVDVRNILASEQRKILAGCRIVFSRVFPVGETSPHMHPLWQTAEQFGAVCTNQIDEQVTHVVANSLGTDKVNWALWTGRFVVHPGWVEASALLYRRANEHDFAIKS